jgi:flagellar protein FliO/FliZ
VTGMAAPSPVSVSSLAQLTLSLVAIVGLIFALGWIMKRLKVAGPRNRGDIAVIDELALGPRERILLVRVGDAQVLVGVGGVVGLTPLTSPITIKDSAPASPFADRLRDFMKRSGSPE